MATQQPGNDNRVTMEKWNELNFSGKEFCSLNDGQEIVLNATAYSPVRKLSQVNNTNCEAVVTALSDKFADVQAKVAELEAEWQKTEDKTKCAGKIARLKEYLLHANALGNYTPLFESLIAKEGVVEEQYASNYAAKLALTEKVESLKDSEDWRAVTDTFKELIEEWKNLPPIPKGKNEALWARIEAARSHFYGRKRAHQEEIDREMMQNLDLKIEICEQAEKLAMSDAWRNTTEAHKELMDRWKTIGRVVSNEKNEELWQRFLQARNTFFDRKKAHFEKVNEEQEANYRLKLALVERAESMQDSTDWRNVSDAYAQLMDEWKKIGKVPIEKAEELRNRLEAARDKFFSARRQRNQEIKVSQEDNYAQKLALVTRAEQIQHSDNWREATDEFNELMTEWKKIGPVPRESSEQLWERFIKARRAFFDRKDADRERRNARFKSQAESRLKEKRDFIALLESELQDDEGRLKEFTESVANTEVKDGKDEEIREHLQTLIRQLESKIPIKKKKIEDARAQLAEMEKKVSDLQTKS
jgi:hypothetical protein